MRLRTGLVALALFFLAFGTAIFPDDHQVVLEAPGQRGDGLFGPTTWTGPSTGQILVGFDAGRIPALQPGDRLAGFPVLASISQLDVLVLQASDLAVATSTLLAQPGLLYVETDGAFSAFDSPDDPRLDEQYGLAMAGFPAAWTTTGYGSAEVLVAVLDSGIARSHPDLQSARIRAGHDYVNRDNTPNDDCGHGTHVTGIVAASTNNGLGVAGASQVSILPLKVLGAGCSGSLSGIAQAIVDATDQKAHIISMSFGSSTDSRTLTSAIAYAWDHDVTLVAAAGNGGRDGTVHYPAASAQVIGVSALDSSKRLAGYSSRGPQVEVAAPGSLILSTTSNGGYGLMSGTSMAAPLVAGALALALGCATTLSNQALRTALAGSAEDLGPAGHDTSFGAGALRADRLIAEVCPPAATSPSASPTSSSASTTATRTGNQSSMTSSSSTSSSAPSIAPTPTAPAFTALFAPTKGCNQWWVEVGVTGNEPINAVAVKVNDGPWRNLPRTSWGSWASSFFVAKGAQVAFVATSATGATMVSPTHDWLGAPPPAGPFTAFFTPRSVGNDWWVETAVQSSTPVTNVDVQFNLGPWNPLPKTAWGTWAKSVHTQDGTSVVFRATSTTGSATSAPVIWR